MDGGQVPNQAQPTQPAPMQAPVVGNAPVPEMPDPYEVASPQLLSLMNSAASQTGKQRDLEAVMRASYSGISPREQVLMKERQAIDAKVNDVLAKTADIPTPQFDALMSRMEQLAGQMGTRKAPTMGNVPSNPYAAVGAGIASIIDPGGAGTYASQYGELMRGEQKRAYEMDAAEFEAESKQLETQYQLTREQARMQQNKDEQVRRSVRDALQRELSVLQNQGEGVDKQLEFVRKQQETALTRYNSANTPEEKRIAAAALEAMDYPIDRESVDRDIQQLLARNSQAARSAWNTQLNQMRDDFGEVPETVVPMLEQQRRELAAMYGVPEEVFGPIPTGRTIAAQKFEQAKKQFDQTFKLRSEEFKQRVAKYASDLELAKQRIAISRAQLGVSQGNLGMRVQEFEFRKAQDAARGVADESTKEIDKIEKEIRILEGVNRLQPPQVKAWTSEEAKKQHEADAKKLQDLKTERDALKLLRQQAIEEAAQYDMGGPGGDVPMTSAQITLPPVGGMDMSGAVNGRSVGRTAKSGGSTKQTTKPNTQAKSGGTSRTVNVGGTNVKVTPVKGK